MEWPFHSFERHLIQRRDCEFYNLIEGIKCVHNTSFYTTLITLPSFDYGWNEIFGRCKNQEDDGRLSFDGSIDESPKSWTLDDGWRCFFSSKSPMKLAKLGPSA